MSYSIESVITTGFLFGLEVDFLQELVGMYPLNKGVSYYGEVHISYWNCLIHTFFMPITMYGLFTWVPAIFNVNPKVANLMRAFTSIAYIFHYVQINIWVTLLIITNYSYPYIRAHRDYTKSFRITGGNSKNFKRGMLLFLTSLLIQEIFGHWVGGDDRSRPEAVPNAIFYAPYYSVGHLFVHGYDNNLIKYCSLTAVFFGLVVFFEFFDRIVDRIFFPLKSK
jgi:hypothetical protein